MMPDMPDHLDRMLTRLKLTAIRDQIDSLIDEAGRRELTIREALTLFWEREIARKDQRRIEMSFGLARFPFSRDLASLDFAAQPSVDRGQIRDLATGAVHPQWRGRPALGSAGRRQDPFGSGHRQGSHRRRLHGAVRPRHHARRGPLPRPIPRAGLRRS